MFCREKIVEKIFVVLFGKISVDKKAKAKKLPPYTPAEISDSKIYTHKNTQDKKYQGEEVRM